MPFYRYSTFKCIPVKSSFNTYRLAVALLEWWADNVWTGGQESLTILNTDVILTLIPRWWPGFSLLDEQPHGGAHTHIYTQNKVRHYELQQLLHVESLSAQMMSNLPPRAAWFHWYSGHSGSVHISHSIHLNQFGHMYIPERMRIELLKLHSHTVQESSSASLPSSYAQYEKKTIVVLYYI